jgi:hypothetical protein
MAPRCKSCGQVSFWVTLPLDETDWHCQRGIGVCVEWDSIISITFGILKIYCFKPRARIVELPVRVVIFLFIYKICFWQIQWSWLVLGERGTILNRVIVIFIYRVIHKSVKHVKKFAINKLRNGSWETVQVFLKERPRAQLPWFAARKQQYHRCCGSGRPWYADTRVGWNGLSYRCLPYN